MRYFKARFRFNQDISGWDVSMVTSTESMFQNASSFDQMIGKWTTTQVTSMTNMFNGASSFNQSLYYWNDILFIELENGGISYNSVTKDIVAMLDNTTSLQYPILSGSVNQNNIYYAVNQLKKQCDQLFILFQTYTTMGYTTGHRHQRII